MSDKRQEFVKTGGGVLSPYYPTRQSANLGPLGRCGQGKFWKDKGPIPTVLGVT